MQYFIAIMVSLSWLSNFYAMDTNNNTPDTKNTLLLIGISEKIDKLEHHLNNIEAIVDNQNRLLKDDESEDEESYKKQNALLQELNDVINKYKQSKES